MRPKDALQKIAAAISRKRNAAAIVIPRRVAVSLADEMYPPEAFPEDAMDFVVGRARAKYMNLVERGGYIGTIMDMPMIVADDVVICSLTKQELHESADRLGVDLNELSVDLHRAGVA